ncbi:hypothetical protein [Roseicyclus mahoneyensis]|jgi:hypothetical protein|uniref:Uncharacterized protein n=1 Tax=Roseicyclus mahoneyensis TaxID=164332 RepID=A0A316GDV5_9RHOB|nr:hypothetical protein [Roseicyclus mahoneyensis]PWK59161.1 hypothetical protein C7455_10983 [Roseicyclus mahoneyensis]
MMQDILPAPAPVVARPGGLLARLFPPLTPAQADVLARIKFPCC